MHSDFLFASPSRLSGWARLLDLFGAFDDYNTSASRPMADARALYADWVVTGEDVRAAMAEFENFKNRLNHDSQQGELFPATAG